MIAKLAGILDHIDDESLVINVNGVGYLVAASAPTLGKIGAVGDQISLYIETQISESDIRLFGFLHEDERRLFNFLQSVQGVGAKAALSLLSLDTPSALLNAISAEDKAVIKRANGVGPKLAARIINELKDKVGVLPMNVDNPLAREAKGLAHSMQGDLSSALSNLGYRSADAELAAAHAINDLGNEAGFDQLLRMALKYHGS